MKVKYIISFEKEGHKSPITGFLRTGKHLPEGFSQTELIDHLCAKHNIEASWGLEIRLRKFTSKNFKYDNTIRRLTQGIARKATHNRN